MNDKGKSFILSTTKSTAEFKSNVYILLKEGPSEDNPDSNYSSKDYLITSKVANELLVSFLSLLT